MPTLNIQNFEQGCSDCDIAESVPEILPEHEVLACDADNGIIKGPLPVSPPSIVTPVVTGNVIATHDDSQGTVVNIEETVTQLIDNGDGSFTYIDENGDPTLVQLTVDINVDTFTYDAATKTLTITETDGTVHPINLSDLVDPPSSMTANPDGSFTHDDGSGNVTVIPAPVPSSVTQVVTTGTVIATHDDGDGNSVDILVDLCAMMQDLPVGPPIVL